MRTPFRPNLEPLDPRELPSVTPFTFTLATGTVVSGTFNYDGTAVDSALASQQVPVSDVTVALNGQAALVVELAAPLATFAQGQLEAVSLTAVAVTGDVAALIDTTGSLTSVSVTSTPVTPVPPLDPTQTIPADLLALVGSYNNHLAQLNQLAANIQINLMWLESANQLLGAYLEVVETAQDPTLRNTAQGAANQIWSQIINAQGQLYSDYTQYNGLYITIQAEYGLILQNSAPDLRQILGVSAPPPKITVNSSLYQDYLDSLV